MKKLALGLAAFVLSAVVAAPGQAISLGNVSLTLNPVTGTVSNIVNGNIAGATLGGLGVNTLDGFNSDARTNAFNPTTLFGSPLSALFVDIDYNNFAGPNRDLNFRVYSNGSIVGTFKLANALSPSSGSFTYNLLAPNPTGINLASLANTNLAFSYILNPFNEVNFQTSVRLVPEPTTMAGLFVFGAAVATRKKLAKKAAV